MIIKTILLSLFLVSAPIKALADDMFISYGLGIFESSVHSFAETKIIDLGYRQDILNKWIYWNYEVGGWLDSSGDPNRSSSLFISTGPGFMVNLHPVEIRNSWGVAAISNTDSYLAGTFPQFHGELYVGVRDDQGRGIGVKYNHFSSAGIFTPNIGRDFWLLELSQKLW